MNQYLNLFIVIAYVQMWVVVVFAHFGYVCKQWTWHDWMWDQYWPHRIQAYGQGCAYHPPSVFVCCSASSSWNENYVLGKPYDQVRHRQEKQVMHASTGEHLRRYKLWYSWLKNWYKKCFVTPFFNQDSVFKHASLHAQHVKVMF